MGQVKNKIRVQIAAPLPLNQGVKVYWRVGSRREALDLNTNFYNRMWERVELGKIMRRQVRNGAQKMVVKDFLIEERIAEGDDWKVMTVVDQETMVRGTLKMILKNENMSKERKDQIFE